MHVPITFLVNVYNEEQRLPYVLQHATQWADEVLVVDKSSTDTTADICAHYGARVVRVPFSKKGHDDAVSVSRLPTHDWIFYGVASEIPTRTLVKRCRDVLSETGGTLDLVYVPRKYYSFGLHDPRSPWNVVYFPFLVNRTKAIVSNRIHHNFAPRDADNTRRITFSEDCCVYHLTHPTVSEYLEAVRDYAEAEAFVESDAQSSIARCLGTVRDVRDRLGDCRDEVIGHYFAWNVQWFATALAVWERWRGVDVRQHYRQMTEELLASHWQAAVGSRGQHIAKGTDGAGARQSTTVGGHDSRDDSSGRAPAERRRFEKTLSELEAESWVPMRVWWIAGQFAGGNYRLARRHLWRLLISQPILLLYRPVQSLLAESVVGTNVMDRYRQWRRDRRAVARL